MLAAELILLSDSQVSLLFSCSVDWDTSSDALLLSLSFLMQFLELPPTLPLTHGLQTKI